MDGLGTQMGTAHRQRQGTGLATVLQGNEALDAATRAWQYDMAQIARRDAERQSKREAAMTRMKSYSPEFWYKHQGEIKTALNEHIGKGAELIGKGIDDPFTATDPESVAFQKEHARISAMSNASMQVKAQWEEIQKKVLGSNPDDYDARALANAMSYFDAPLSDIVANSSTPPTLQKKRPFLDMMDLIGKNMAAWQNTRGGQPPTDEEVFAFVDSLVTQPDNRQQFVEGYASKMAQLEPEEQQRIGMAAKMAGREAWQQMAYEDAKRFQKQREAFDLQKELSQAANMAEQGVSYTEWSTPEGFGKAPKKGAKEAAIKSAVDATFNSDNRWMEVFNREGELPRGAEETDGEYARRVKAHMAKQLDPLVGVDTKSGRTDKGAQDQERTRSREAFLADIRSGDRTRMQDAANILIGTPYSANMRIEDANVFQQSPDAYWLELEVTTPLSTDKIQTEIANDMGVPEEQITVQNRQGKKIVNIGLAPGAVENQTLVRLLDNYMKQTGGTYDPKFTQRSARTAIEAAKMPTSLAPASKQPTTGADFWK